MRSAYRSSLPCVLAGVMSTALLFAACSSSDDAAFPHAGGSAGDADASKGGTSGGSGSGGVATTGGSAGNPTGGSAGNPTGGSAGNPTGGSGGNATGGSGGNPTGGSGGNPTGGSAGNPTGGSAGNPTGGSAGNPTGGSGGNPTGGSGGNPTGGSGGNPTGGSGGNPTGGSGGNPTGGSGGNPTGGSGGNPTGGSGGNPTGGSGGNPTGGSGGTNTGGSGGTNTGGSGGTILDAGVCNGQATSIETIASGAFPDNTYVNIAASVVTSPKFQVTGGCLWGVFVKDSASHAGSLVVSTGTLDIYNKCAQGTDQLPVGLQPGDILSIRGKVMRFVPTNCIGMPPVIEIVVEGADQCTSTKLGTGPAPIPLTVTPSDLMPGSMYPNQLVRVTNVYTQDWPDGGVTDNYGSMQLYGSGLVLRDAIYYRTEGAPVFSSGEYFNEVVGINGQPIVVSGVCSWTLLPRYKCVDFDPKSQDCPI